MISVVAYIHVKPEDKEEALKAAQDLVKEVKNESGTLSYSLNIDEKNPQTLIFMEKYKDMDAFIFHSKTDYFKIFAKKIEKFSLKPAEIKILKEIDSI